MDRLPSWVPLRLGLVALAGLTLLGAAPVAALSFGANASTTVSGNCMTMNSFQNSGGSLVNAAQAADAKTGPTSAGSCPAVYGTLPWLGQADARAILNTGQLKVFAHGEGPEANGNLFPSASPVNLSVLSTASFFDTFRLIPPAGFTGTTSIIEVRLTMSQSVSLAQGSNFQSNTATLNWRLVTNTLTTNRCNEMGIIASPTTCTALGQPGTSTILHRFSVPIANPQVSLSAQVSARTINNATADAFATGQLSILLEPGFTYDSDSRKLLVPEPGSALLLGAGLVALAGRARIRKR